MVKDRPAGAVRRNLGDEGPIFTQSLYDLYRKFKFWCYRLDGANRIRCFDA